MQGRWTIFKWGALSRVEGGPDTESVPVVPCDAAAIERGGREARVAYLKAKRHRNPEQLWREVAEAVLRAAGETT